MATRVPTGYGQSKIVAEVLRTFAGSEQFRSAVTATAYLGWAPWPWRDGFEPTNKLSVLVDVETVHDDPVPGRSTVYERARIPRDKVSAFDMVRAGALAAAAYDRTPRQGHDGQY